MLPAAFLLLLAATIGGENTDGDGARLSGRIRAPLVVVGLLAVAAIVIPTVVAGQLATSRVCRGRR